MDWFQSPKGGPRWKGLRDFLPTLTLAEQEEVTQQLCLTYPTWFFEYLTEVKVGYPTVLEDFQIAYLLDESRFKITNKTRQAGGSLGASMAKFWKCYRNEGVRVDVVSVNLKEATDKITYVRNLWESLPISWRHPLCIDNSLSIGFHSGRRKSVINSLAASSGVRGGRKDVVVDEAAHIDKFEDIFVGALPGTIRDGGGFDIISTPLGDQGKFAEIWFNRPNARGQRPFDGWSHHSFIWIDVSFFCKNINEARRVWTEELGENMSFMDQLYDEFATDELRAIADSFSNEQFHQEFCGEFLSESGAFFPWSVINPCIRDTEPWDSGSEYLELWHARPEHNDHEVMVGIDFAEGKKGGDSTSIQVVEKDSDGKFKIRYSLDLTAGEGWNDFDRQLNMVDDVIDRFKPQRVSVDATGLGVTLAPSLIKKHGSLIDPVNFNNARKEEMALNLKGLLERQALWLPRDNKPLHGQIRNIKRTISAHGSILYEGKPHDDMFWALALACKDARRVSYQFYRITD